MFLLGGAASAAQQPEAPPGQALPRIEERVEVVAITPVHGIGLDKSKVPANVQVFTAGQAGLPLAQDVTTLLTERAAGVQASDVQAGTFQPDLLFRGFVGSPLLGASEGLAAYQDGVRINDPFADTIQWDTLPSAAIASINVMPGSNPLFGLNALGGALSIRTKDGFDFPGHRVSASTGAYGRHGIEVESGAHSPSFGYFLSGGLTDESGWRDFSPSTIRRVFGDIAWRGQASAAHFSVTAAANDLTGNGPAPVALLDVDRRAVFTHPDRTDNDVVLVTARASRPATASTQFEGVAYYRRSRTGTFNGDADVDDDELHDAIDDRVDAVNNVSTTRGASTGVTGQMTRTTPLWGRANHFIAGAGFDAADTHFTFATELAHLTPDRGTVGSGVFDDDAYVDLRSGLVTGSAFLTNVWSPRSAVAVSGSVRVNWTAVRLRDQIGTALSGDHRFRRVNPAGGITYQARPWLNIYGSYSQSSRVPTPVELTCADPEDPCRLPNAFVSDPPLDQIVAATWEAGLRGTAVAMTWTVAGFTTVSKDDIIFVSSGTARGEGHFQNVARTRRQGVEAVVDYRPRPWLSAFGAYSVQRAAFGTSLRIASQFHPDAENAEIAVEAGDRLPGVPTHSGKAGLTAMVGDRLSVGVSVRAQSGQFFRGDEANLLAPLPGFKVVNAHAQVRIMRRVALVAQAQNILDSDYYTFGVLGDAESLGFGSDPRFNSPGAPRAAWVGVQVQF